jgi:hypothetical protein
MQFLSHGWLFLAAVLWECSPAELEGTMFVRRPSDLWRANKSKLDGIVILCYFSAAFPARILTFPHSCNATSEATRYTPLIQTYNRALQRLKSVHVPGLREASDGHQLLFHFNDKPIVPDCNGGLKTYYFKPDIVGIQLREAQLAYEKDGDDGSWEDYAFRTALNKPKNAMKWGWVLCSHEVQAVKSILTGPPEHYKVSTLNEHNYKEADTSSVRAIPSPVSPCTTMQYIVNIAPDSWRSI